MNKEELIKQNKNLDHLRTVAWLKGELGLYKYLSLQYDMNVNFYFDLIQDKARTEELITFQENEIKIQKGSFNYEKCVTLNPEISRLNQE